MKRRGHLCVILLSISILSGCAKNANELAKIRIENTHKDFTTFSLSPKLPDRALSLEDLIAFALHRNLDLLALNAEYAIQHETATGEKLAMLPNLTINSEWSQRSNESASKAKSLVTGLTSTGSSTSSTRSTTRRDFSVVWGLLDFGLSYYRSRQEENRGLIIKQRIERLRQNLILDIIQAYWKAVITQKAVKGASSIIAIAKERQKDLQRRLEKQTVSEIQGLENEERLIEMQIRLQTFQSDLHSAKAELASLLGLTPNSDIALQDTVLKPISEIDLRVEELEETALLNRPELFIQDLEGKLNADEIRATMLSYFPNPSLFSTYNYDRNRFLVNKTWLTMGVRAAWNLLSFPRYQQEKKIAKERVIQNEKSRQSLSIGILTQVRLAYLIHQNAKAQHKLSQDLYIVKSRLLKAVKKGERLGEYGGAETLELEAEALFSKINSLTSYAEMYISLERINNSIGKPLYFSNLNLENIITNKIGLEKPLETKKDHTPTEEHAKAPEEMAILPKTSEEEQQQGKESTGKETQEDADNKQKKLPSRKLEGYTADEELEGTLEGDLSHSADEELSEEDIEKIRKSQKEKEQKKQQPGESREKIRIVLNNKKDSLEHRVNNIATHILKNMPENPISSPHRKKETLLSYLDIQMPPDKNIEEKEKPPPKKKNILAFLREDNSDEILTEELLESLLENKQKKKPLSKKEILAQIHEDLADEEITISLVQKIFKERLFNQQVAEIKKAFLIEREETVEINKRLFKKQQDFEKSNISDSKEDNNRIWKQAIEDFERKNPDLFEKTISKNLKEDNHLKNLSSPKNTTQNIPDPLINDKKQTSSTNKDPSEKQPSLEKPTISNADENNDGIWKRAAKYFKKINPYIFKKIISEHSKQDNHLKNLSSPKNTTQNIPNPLINDKKQTSSTNKDPSEKQPSFEKPTISNADENNHLKNTTHNTLDPLMSDKKERNILPMLDVFPLNNTVQNNTSIYEELISITDLSSTPQEKESFQKNSNNQSLIENPITPSLSNQQKTNSSPEKNQNELYHSLENSHDALKKVFFTLNAFFDKKEKEISNIPYENKEVLFINPSEKRFESLVRKNTENIEEKTLSQEEQHKKPDIKLEKPPPRS